MKALRFLAMAIVLLLGGCSDAFLYGVGQEDPSPDRLGLSGRVCTDDAAEAGFPVKVIFLADVANGPLFAWDSEQVRLQAIRDALSIHQGNQDFSFASLRGNAVLRWEYRPGSALFLVWTQQRDDFEPEGEFKFRRGMSNMLKAQADNVFMVKLSYYLGL